MYLIHEATIRNFNGVIDVTVHIVRERNGLPFERKGYIYHIGSEYAVKKFMDLYKKGRKFHGKALTYLNKFKIKEERGNQ